MGIPEALFFGDLRTFKNRSNRARIPFCPSRWRRNSFLFKPSRNFSVANALASQFRHPLHGLHPRFFIKSTITTPANFGNPCVLRGLTGAAGVGKRRFEFFAASGAIK